MPTREPRWERLRRAHFACRAGFAGRGDPVRVQTSLQEVYHTRLLADVVSLFDVSVRRQPPHADELMRELPDGAYAAAIP